MRILGDAGPPLEEEVYRLIRELVNRFCGIMFPDESRFIVERRLRERLDAVGVRTYSDYYHFLRYHPDAHIEIERAVDVLTTNETYFFREDYQLRAFRDEILPELHERGERTGQRRLSVWSAGCSTGEEVYTLAMLVDSSPIFHGWDVRIFGNDISKRVLRTARRATYGRASFRAMPDAYLSYFHETGEGKQVIPRIRAMCSFGHLNLLEHDRTAIVGRVDVVFCRNVLIYFDQGSRRKVLESFYQRLVPGGYLLLGHSESLLNASTAFELVHLSSDLVYRRPQVGPSRPFLRGRRT